MDSVSNQKYGGECKYLKKLAFLKYKIVKVMKRFFKLKHISEKLIYHRALQ